MTLKGKFLSEVARRTGARLDLVSYGTILELARFLQGTFPLDTWKERRRGSLYVYSKGKNRGIYTGKIVDKFLANACPKVDKNISELKGFSASLGLARGRVRLILTVSDIGQMKEGEILVTSMTRPEHLPAMKRAAAIVTDDGGITCHAAIVARELNKPCIIGTRIATQVLKNGDLVELDANVGIVKKVK